MSIPTIYIQGTKSAINGALNEGRRIIGTIYTLFDERCEELAAMPSGTVIKFWVKKVNGTPIAKAYGTWDASKKRIK